MLTIPKQPTSLVDYLPEDSWFRDYMSLWGHTEPPRSYLLFSAMAMLGACLGRKVYMVQDPHILYPMTNLLLVGPSGSGKSTSIYMAKEILDNYLDPTLAPKFIQGQSTQEGLHKALVSDPHAIIFASELANFFGKQRYMEGMIPYITELFDYKDRMERRLMAGVSTIIQPSATLMGGSTREWLQKQLPDTATTGGFLPRFFIVKEDYRFQRNPNPRESMGERKWGEHLIRKAEVFSQFSNLVQGLDGEIRFEDYDARDTYGQWYQTYEPATGHLSAFAARAGEFVLRLSVIIARSCNGCSVRAPDVQAAIRLYEYASRKLQEVVVPFSAVGELQAKVLELVGREGISLQMLCRSMRNYITSADVQKLVESLIMTGDLKRDANRIWRMKT